MIKRLLLFFVLLPHFLSAQQPGCTDLLATNYDPGATVNDGSCIYPPISYSLTVKTNLAVALNENSGLVMAGGALWTHNDSGSAAEIYQIDTLSNTVLRTVNLENATNVDWEDMTFDGQHFYIGDFGNNANGNRTDLKIYKFPLSAIPAGAAVTVPAAQISVINFSYEDQTNFDPTGSNSTRFDCEALIFQNDSLHLFTKNWLDKTTTHYTLPATAGTYQAQPRESYDVKGLVTAAAISNKDLILLLCYDLASGKAFYWQVWDYPTGNFFSGNKRRIDLGFVFQTGQVEGICFRSERSGYVSNENTAGLVPARLYGFEIGQSQLTKALEPDKSPAIPPCAVSPNPLPAGQQIQLQSWPAEAVKLQIWNSQGQLLSNLTWPSNDLPVLPAGTYLVQLQAIQGGALCRSLVAVKR